MRAQATFQLRGRAALVDSFSTWTAVSASLVISALILWGDQRARRRRRGQVGRGRGAPW